MVDEKRGMKINYNLLICSAGRRVSLIRLFQKALKDLQMSGLVYAVDIDITAPALHAADKFEIVSKVTEVGYINQLLKICIENEISLVIPTIDTELDILSKNTSLFEKNGIQILVSSENVNQISSNKINTNKFFENNNIPTASLHTFEASKKLIKSGHELFIKPSSGSSSENTYRVQNLDELNFFYNFSNDMIIQDFIEGEEYTIDIFVDFNGKVRCAVPRLRIETRAGEVSKSITVRDQEIIEWSYKIADALDGSLGCLTFQCIKESTNSVKFIEINPRFGGGFPLSSAAGADFPRWILQILLNFDLEENLQFLWTEGLYMLRYDHEIFTTKDQL